MILIFCEIEWIMNGIKVSILGIKWFATFFGFARSAFPIFLIFYFSEIYTNEVNSANIH